MLGIQILAHRRNMGRFRTAAVVRPGNVASAAQATPVKTLQRPALWLKSVSSHTSSISLTTYKFTE
jgi:hypothetical protein